MGWQGWLERGLAVVLGVGVLFAAGDWGAWRLREARGVGTGEVTVTRVVVAPLKNHKEEYYPDGVEAEPCSRSVLPWGGMRACWWVERHHFEEER